MDSQEINLSNNCESFESEFFVSEQLLLHNCDALGGSSGGPIISTAEDGEARNVIAVHGGTLSSGISGGKSFSAGRPAGAKVNPEQWINQARKIDRAMLIQLQQFLAYLAKDFPSQK